MPKFVMNTRSVKQSEQVGETKPGKFEINEKGKRKEDTSKKEEKKERK